MLLIALWPSSQNCSGWREPWRLSGPTPCSEQGQLQQAAQGCVQPSFEDLWGWRLHRLSSQPVPVLGHPCRKYVSSFVHRGGAGVAH